jgi:drug/metabolite transporter (DMT)-like permease
LALFLLSNFSTEKKDSGTEWLLAVAVFAVLGFNDFLMKIFESLRPLEEKNTFLLVLFGISGVLSWLFIWASRISIHPVEVLWGLGLGIPNMLTTFFFILALSRLPGVEVFPSVNIGIIGFSLLLGIWIWGEKLSRREWAGFILALVAVTLLNVHS